MTTLIAAKIRAVTLGSNFTARISCQVPFCRCKISGLELVFSVIDPDFKAVDQLIGVKLYLSNLYYNPWHGVVRRKLPTKNIILKVSWALQKSEAFWALQEANKVSQALQLGGDFQLGGAFGEYNYN